MTPETLDMLAWEKQQGLLPAIVQDADSRRVLMLGYMNREALAQTLRSGRATFYSRSKQRLWQKGESSGHTQEVKEIYIDCDADCVLMKVVQNVAACHTGYRSCFYRKWEQQMFVIAGKKVFNEEDVYKQ